jgi:hypothetical protein
MGETPVQVYAKGVARNRFLIRPRVRRMPARMKFALSLGYLTLLSSAALGESTSAVINTFGLIGIWSADCAKGPTQGAGRIIFASPTFGAPTMTNMVLLENIVEWKTKFEIQSANLITDEKLKITTVFTETTGAPSFVDQRTINRKPQELVFLKIGTKIQPITLNGERGEILEKCLN